MAPTVPQTDGYSAAEIDDSEMLTCDKKKAAGKGAYTLDGTECGGVHTRRSWGQALSREAPSSVYTVSR